MKTFELNKILRPHFLRVKPYRSARNDFEGDGFIQLDANENPYPERLNRYPDPLQKSLKQKIAEVKNCEARNIFIGNGSDEAIDLLIRAFCEPGKDNIITPVPTYGMYRVAAEINDVRVKEVLLDDFFDLKVEELLAACDDNSKIIFLCSPNNPTGNGLKRASIKEIIQRFNGIVVVDEAYIDFSSQESLISELQQFPNLLILQTLSKAWGLAGIRVGICFGNPKIIQLLNNIKPPYNVSITSQETAIDTLSKGDATFQLACIISERNKLIDALTGITAVEKVFPSDANFLLVRIKQASRCYEFLKRNGIIVRDRSHEPLCSGCLRITIGTESENEKLLQVIKTFNPDYKS